MQDEILKSLGLRHCRAREIILADKRDGKTLDAKEGPFRIVAPGDKRPARWIRQITALKVITVQ
jgi:hypothetical protein